MAECPGCFGEGCHDMRDMDAFLLEHFTAEEIGLTDDDKRVVDCVECDGTGVVSDERRAEILAESRAIVERVIAKYELEHRHQAWPHGVEPPC